MVVIRWAAGVALLAALLFVVTTEVDAVLDYRSTLVAKTDFEGALWQPARDVLEGVSPYRDPSAPGFVALAVYPPSAFLFFLPLALMPLGQATLVFQGLLAAAALVALLAVGVRDLRCLALWLLSPLVVVTVLIANATLLVILCAALMWRFRDVAWAVGGALVAAVAIKLFLAPLWLWLVFTKRYRAALYAGVAAPLVLLGSWAVIGFDGLVGYPHLLSIATSQWGGDGPFIYALGRHLGGADAARVLSLSAAVGLLALAWKRRRSALDSFALAAAAAVALSPVAWFFYTGVLVVAFAAARPRYDALWLFLPLFWIHWWYSPLDYRSVELSVATIALTAGLTAASLQPAVLPISCRASVEADHDEVA